MTIEREIRIDRHAYDRYCERVEPIGWRELEEQVRGYVDQEYFQQDGYLKLGEIWWRGFVSDSEIMLHTCYGKTHIDIPNAIRWAKRYNDRLRLNIYAD